MKRRGFIAALAALPAAIAGAAKASVTKKPETKAEPYTVEVVWKRDVVEAGSHDWVGWEHHPIPREWVTKARR